jgi:hypothetical protein
LICSVGRRESVGEMHRLPYGRGSVWFAELEGGWTAESYVRCEPLMDIGRRLESDASMGDDEDYKLAEKNRQKICDFNVSVGTGQGCEQDANADC